MREVAGSPPGLDFYILCEPICVSLCLFHCTFVQDADVSQFCPGLPEDLILSKIPTRFLVIIGITRSPLKSHRFSDPRNGVSMKTLFR
jgi:hypothetical protein